MVNLALNLALTMRAMPRAAAVLMEVMKASKPCSRSAQSRSDATNISYEERDASLRVQMITAVRTPTVNCVTTKEQEPYVSRRKQKPTKKIHILNALPQKTHHAPTVFSHVPSFTHHVQFVSTHNI
jgi:hypothetical protein